MTDNGYRIEWTRFVPGGCHSRECSAVRGDLSNVRDFLDSQMVYGREPIIVIEYTQSDQLNGRVIPASEWDIDEEEI